MLEDNDRQWIADRLEAMETRLVEQLTEREWIVQRCTQRWIGTELVYEDWPRVQCALTRREMLEKLEEQSRQYPDDEFRGHNVAHCGCAAHAALKKVKLCRTP